MGAGVGSPDGQAGEWSCPPSGLEVVNGILRGSVALCCASSCSRVNLQRTPRQLGSLESSSCNCQEIHAPGYEPCGWEFDRFGQNVSGIWHLLAVFDLISSSADQQLDTDVNCVLGEKNAPTLFRQRKDGPLPPVGRR
jgi:hypothetical protein